jgi:hypothetical protein
MTIQPFSSRAWIRDREAAGRQFALEVFRNAEPEVHDFLLANLGSSNQFIRSVANRLYTTQRLTPRQIEAVRSFINNRSK